MLRNLTISQYMWGMGDHYHWSSIYLCGGEALKVLWDGGHSSHKHFKLLATVIAKEPDYDILLACVAITIIITNSSLSLTKIARIMHNRPT